MENLYKKYWIEEPKEVHEYKKGTYHVSQVGNGYPDLETDEHSGPCLRQGYWEYIDPIKQNDGTTGNFRIGSILHKKIQKIIKINNPAVINEFPLRQWIRNVIVSGSIDTVIFTKEGVHVIDFKTASQYTLPKGEFDKNPTHFTQVYIYAYLLSMILKLDIIDVSVIYINKHNLETFKQTEKYDKDKAKLIYIDFNIRCFKLHLCLKDKAVPHPEPMKWCKFCKYLKRCIEVGDVEMVMKGRYMKGLKVISND